jgi:hypothetical protein
MKFKAKAIPFTSAVLAAGALLLSGCTITDFTSSTSDTLDTVTPDVSLNRFVDTRIAAIQQEAANGKGENLDALAYMLGKEDRAEFAGWMQVHYDELFTGLSQPTQLLSRIASAQTGARI